MPVSREDIVPAHQIHARLTELAEEVRRRRYLLSIFLLCMLFGMLLSAPAAAYPPANKPADSQPAEASSSKDPKAEEKRTPQEQFSTTPHTLRLKAKDINYRATTGRLWLEDGKGEKRALIFFVAYERELPKGQPAGDTSRRPVTFVFNGGPGASSIFLHLGALGPQRLLVGEDGKALAPPFTLVPNEFTWLDFTDLVFIDPVETGFSRPAPQRDAKDFFNVQEDAAVIGDFIRTYTTRYNRWASPKFLAGASYGSTRAAALSEYLQETHGMNLNGVILVSPVLDFQTITPGGANDLPYALFFPSYTATAWFHHKLADGSWESLEEAVANAEGWVQEKYVEALFRGNGLTGEERETLAGEISKLTGLSEDYVRQTDMRIRPQRFMKELLRSEGVTTGRFDSRFRGMDRDAAGEAPEYDPSLSEFIGLLTSAMNSYVRNDLQYKEDDEPYKNLNSDVSRAWKWSAGLSGGQGYVSLSDALRDAMVQNTYLRVWLACGFYDLATPYFAVRYTVNHLGLPSEVRENISMAIYEGGHMFYLDPQAIGRFRDDAAAFFEATLGVKATPPPAGKNRKKN